MAGSEHHYTVALAWTGDRGEGTSRYSAFGRDHLLSAPGKPDIPGSSDPNFRGDAARWNPEELLLASLSACHQLWFLHLCSVNGVTVTAYADEAEGWMAEEADGAGQFTRALLKPRVTIAAGDLERLAELHHQAHEKCFIARSVNFPVDCEPAVTMA